MLRRRPNLKCKLKLHLQALLLWTQMAVFYVYVLKLFWSPTTSSTARSHLRVVVLLKSCAFVLYALQLRHTYPPRASYRWGGSTTFCSCQCCTCKAGPTGGG